MKKAIIAITAALTALALLAGCEDRIKGTDNVEAAGGEAIAAVTNEDGGLQRDSSGRIIVAVTGEDGEAITDNSGEVATIAQAVTHAITTGDVIDYSTFSITVPKGWVSPASNNFDTITIDAEDQEKTGNKIVIYSTDKSDEAAQSDYPAAGLFRAIKGYDGVKVEKNETNTVKIAGVEATEQRVEISTTIENFDYRLIDYYTFESGNSVFGVMCYSNSADTDSSVFTDVLNCMTLY